MKSIKCVIIGDRAVGKTSFLTSHISNTFLKVHIPTIFDSFSSNNVIQDEHINLTLYDTGSSSDLEELRKKTYLKADLVVICFSVVRMDTFQSISTLWIPEIRSCREDLPFLLVGTQTDLLNDIERIKEMSKYENQGFLTENEMQDFCSKSGSLGYYPCSSKSRDNIADTFKKIVRLCWYSQELRRSQVSNLFKEAVSIPELEPKSPMSSFKMPASKLTKDLHHSLFGRNRKWCDLGFTFANEPKKRIWAHRAIIATRAPLWAEAIESIVETVFEKKNTIVVLKLKSNIHYKVFKMFLRYLYTGRVILSEITQENTKNLDSLCSLAIKFGVAGLMEICDYLLEQEEEIWEDERDEQETIEFIQKSEHLEALKITKQMKNLLKRRVFSDFVIFCKANKKRMKNKTKRNQVDNLEKEKKVTRNPIVSKIVNNKKIENMNGEKKGKGKGEGKEKGKGKGGGKGAENNVNTDQYKDKDKDKDNDNYKGINGIFEKIHVHRAVISARCKYFYSLLRGDFQENSQQKIYFKSIPHDQMKLIIEYLYTDTIPKQLGRDVLIELCFLADYFGLKRLAILSIKELLSNANSRQIIEAFQISQRIVLNECQNVCLLLIAKNYQEIKKKFPNFSKLFRQDELMFIKKNIFPPKEYRRLKKFFSKNTKKELKKKPIKKFSMFQKIKKRLSKNEIK
ncbi:gtp-binding protein rho5 [Anaeramoeba flamelloides]|uniref:Gtp-binding protein rho5 n=1 Tax=Anaeramoeba flamelloides TaxID=1746091 RepID=A0AAV7Z531_9EUKA|nr:gtp-binding protein rho5 [Anaeramoeba flamelloides]